nr:hypothetical protein [Streptomyces sp. CB01881]
MPFALVGVAASFFLERTYAERPAYAVGGNPETARPAGIRGDRRVVPIYVASSLVSALVGVLVLSRTGVCSAGGVGVGWELQAIAAAVIERGLPDRRAGPGTGDRRRGRSAGADQQRAGDPPGQLPPHRRHPRPVLGLAITAEPARPARGEAVPTATAGRQPARTVKGH